MAQREIHPSKVLVLMGVSGSGKTTVGQRLADRLGWDFVDGDAFHPDANVKKMARGEPLTDADRAPWLRALQQFIHKRLANDDPAIVACSALKAAYREVLRAGNDGVRFVYLRGEYDLIRRRMEARDDHFFKPDLLASQFDALEEPTDALTISIDQSPADIVDAILDAF